MTKENKSTEHAEQRERRLELLQRQGTSLCPNDTRFLIERHAARLSEDNQHKSNRTGRSRKTRKTNTGKTATDGQTRKLLD